MKAELFVLLLVPFLLAGCCSMSDLSERPVAPGVWVDDNARPPASYFFCNHSYKLFGCVPLSTGVTWKGGEYDDWNVEFIADHCTIDENLASVKAAAAKCGTDRVCSLITTEDTSWLWSLFLVKHTELKTTCVICEPVR